jgi:haloacetate dehalogenase
MTDLFPGFRRELVRANGIDIHAVIGPKRDAPALLLLHGYPQTSAIWHKVAPRLAELYNVVVTDLARLRRFVEAPGEREPHELLQARDGARPGGGDGGAGLRPLPAGGTRPRRPRGASLAVGPCPTGVESLVVLDIAPTLAMYEQTTEIFARAYWHWFFLILPALVPEAMIGADAKAYPARQDGRQPRSRRLRAGSVGRVRALLHAGRHPRELRGLPRRRRASTSSTIAPTATPGASSPVRSSRCGASVASSGAASGPLDEWKRVAPTCADTTCRPGHYIPEEAPDVLVAKLGEFFGGRKA